MRTVCMLVLVGFGALAWGGAASARMQAGMYCWQPDAELPVSCDEDPPEDDGGELSSSRGRVSVWLALKTGAWSLKPSS
jgi:hypothetical protein